MAEKYKDKPAAATEDEDTVQRTLMYWNIQEGTTEESLVAAVKRSLEEACKWEDGAIVNAMVKEKRNGQGLYGRVVYKDMGMATAAFFLQESPVLQELRDGKGTRGVRVEQSRTINQIQMQATQRLERAVPMQARAEQG